MAENTSRLHIVDLDTKVCDSILSGDKTFVVVHNGHLYQKGDIIRFKPMDNDYMCIDSESPINDIEYSITFVESSNLIKSNFVIVGISKVNKDAE